MSNYIPDPIERMKIRQDIVEDECTVNGELVCIECKRPESEVGELLAASPSPCAPPVCAGCLGFDPFDEI